MFFFCFFFLSAIDLKTRISSGTKLLEQSRDRPDDLVPVRSCGVHYARTDKCAIPVAKACLALENQLHRRLELLPGKRRLIAS